MADNLCVKQTLNIVEITKIGATISTRLLKNSNTYALPAVVLGYVDADRDVGQALTDPQFIAHCGRDMKSSLAVTRLGVEDPFSAEMALECGRHLFRSLQGHSRSADTDRSTQIQAGVVSLTPRTRLLSCARCCRSYAGARPCRKFAD